MPLNHTYSENELVHLLRQRNESGFSYLYNNYSGALLSVIKNFIHHDDELAHDILQEVYIRIFRKIDLYDANKSRLYTWMTQIARNLCIDHLRRQKLIPDMKNQEDISDVSGGSHSGNINPDAIGMSAFITRLPDTERDTLLLAYMQGHTQEDISKLLAVPLGTVKSRIRSGLKKLRSMIGEE